MNVRVFFAPLAALLIAPAVFAQMDRRDRRDPALILDPGGRVGTCDVLKVSPDGKTLLAVGDDKVVATWPISNAGLDTKGFQVLRWPIWREQRGAIYAMDISPDGTRVAVGGYGMKNSTVAVIERATGAITSVYASHERQEDANGVTALAFSPDGKQLAIGTGDGSIWTWNLTDKNVAFQGRHDKIRESGLSWVRLVRFDPAGRVLSLAEDGKLTRWNAGNGQTVIDLNLGTAHVRAAALSADQKWLAACTTKNKAKIALRSLDGVNVVDIDLDPRQMTRSVAFSPDAKQVAVGIGATNPAASFYMEFDETVAVYTVGAAAKRTVELDRPGRAEAIAWVGANRLAVAGGDNHEVALWDLDAPKKPVGVARGAGSGLWRVGLSADGRFLAFQDHRNAAAADPNARGTGDWRAFDLKARRFDADAAKKVQPVAPLTTCDDWGVRADDKDSYVWHVENAVTKQSHILPLLRDQDGRPTAYTFVKRQGQPPLLVVGHYWGLSVFDLTANGPRRIKLMTGHQGEVTSVAPSKDGEWLVSASNDQTISAWNMKPWAGGNESFGAAFAPGPGPLKITAVDVGGPAWELGLVAGDEIILAGITADKKRIYAATENVRVTDANGQVLLQAAQLGTDADVRKLIDDAVPGRDLALVWKRPGSAVQIGGRTSIRTRPVWRFFPTQDNEWVLWMWQGSFYDCSTHGDFLIGWHMNDPTAEAQPRFFRAEQMREKFQRKDVIDELVLNRDPPAAYKLALGANPVPLNFATMEPPAVQIVLPQDKTQADVKAKLIAAAADDNPDRVPVRVELWINEFRFQTWKPTGKSFEVDTTIPVAALRAGDNRLTLQVFNRLEGRSEFVKNLKNENAEARSRAYGFAAGIDDYSGTAKTPDGKRNLFGNLGSAVNDARKQQAAWKAQAGKLYEKAEISLKPNQEASPNAMGEELDRLAKVVRPDDRLILCLSGHGDFLSGKGVKSTFVFCGPNYSREKYAESGLEAKVLFEKLAEINCRKVVFLDACHSGDIAFNPIRALTPNGQGPTILAACDRSEYSYENPKYGNGLFTHAVMQAMGDPKVFADADESKDGRLDAVELFRSVQKQMPALLKSVGLPEHAQNPVIFPRRPERFVIYQK